MIKKILVIEDDQELQRTYQTKLKNEGFVPVAAFTGEEGLDIAKKIIPDLIILDLMLPGGPDGFVILSRLKKDPKCMHIPVILSTNIENQILESVNKGAVWYFIKAQTPIDTIMAKIREILKQN